MGCEGKKCSQCSVPGERIILFPEEETPALTAEQEKYKRALYESMSPRRRKFIDRLGYENWDPYQAPKDPLDIRKDRTQRTLQELLREFMAECRPEEQDSAWQAGVKECALGIIQKDARFQGIFDFCLWYARLLERESMEK